MSIRGWDPPAAPPLRPSPEPTRSPAPIVAVVLTCLVLLCVPIIAIVGFHRYASTDHLGVLDDPDVVEAADTACQRMERSVRASAPLPNSSASEIASAMRSQNTAITAMVAEVRSVGADKLRGDHPAEFWLADWEALIDLRESYADALTRGEQPVLTVPLTDGLPITTRMDDVADCSVAAYLAQPPLPER